MSKSVEEMLKELTAFAEKASVAAKADVMIKCAPTEILQCAFRAACNVAISVAKGELKPEHVPNTAPELALIIMGVEAEKRMGVSLDETLGKKESPEKTSGEVGGKPEQSVENTVVREVHVVSGSLDEVMAKIGELIKNDR